MSREDQPLIEDEGAGYLVSVSDLMSGLLFVFIILLVGFILTYTVNQKEPMVPAMQLASAEQERDEWKRKYEELSKEHEALKEKFALVEEKLRQIQLKYAELQVKNEELRTENVRLNAENEELKRLVKEYLLEITSLKKERDALRAKVTALQYLINLRDQEILELKEQIATLRKSLDLFTDMSADDLNKIIQDLQWIKEYLVEYLEQLHTSSKQELMGSLAQAAEEEGLLVNIDERTAIMRVPGIKFVSDMEVGWKSNFSSPREAYKEIRKLGDTLLKVLPCFSGTIEPFNCDPKTYGSLKLVLVEGHVAPNDFSNDSARAMEVSMRHSFTVQQALMIERKGLKHISNRDGEPVFSISGYGANRPISEKKGNMMHDENRRVDLRFIMSTPMIPLEIIEQLKKLGANS